MNVTGSELKRINEQRLKVVAMKAELSAEVELLDTLERAIIDKLKKGAKVVGNFLALVEEVPGTICPKWKDVHLLHMHEAHGVVAEVTERSVRAVTLPCPSRFALKLAAKGKAG